MLLKGATGNMKNKNYLVEWEGTFVDSMGIKSVPYKETIFALDFCGFLCCLGEGRDHWLPRFGWNDWQG